MQIKFISLSLKNFKSHKEINHIYGKVTAITGDNAVGKSTLIEAPVWVLYGTDLFGTKLDPTPINYESAGTIATLQIEVDSKVIQLGRAIERKKAVYYVNDVPTKATDFENLVSELFNKELFLSLYNPSFFFTLHWEKQRSMLLQYVEEVSTKDVLIEMSRVNTPDIIDLRPKEEITLNQYAKALEEVLKKHTRAQLIELHKKSKNDNDTAYKRAQGSVQALHDQLEKNHYSKDELESLKFKLGTLEQAKIDLETKIGIAEEPERKRRVLQSTIESLTQRIADAKDRYMRVHGEVIDVNCPTCNQPLDEEKVKVVEENKQSRKDKLRAEYNALVAEKNEKVEEANGIYLEDLSELHGSLSNTNTSIYDYKQDIRIMEAGASLEQDYKDAQAKQKEVLDKRNHSIFILDAIKMFEAKEAEVQASKVQSLFTSLSVKLFKDQANGERKINFEIERDGKPYSRLSLSESILAGLELRDVIASQSETECPVVVDNSESVFRIVQNSGQLIIVKAVENEKLKIELESV